MGIGPAAGRTEMFQVGWVLAADLLALAKKRGYQGGDGILDYADDTDCVRFVDAPNFAAAVTLAKAKLEHDFFGQVRIERIVKVRDRYTGDRWEAVAVWHLSDSDDILSEDSPEYEPELDLNEDECIVA
ncbi:hypothetical protein Pan3_23 [Pseudanabaena phage Pan3]|nr:hypothetical protein Pan3_23 [Pseudanabaena phage Pan3]